MVRLPDEADKQLERTKRQLLIRLRENRIVVNLLNNRVDKALEERRKLIEQAYKVMTIEEIGKAIGLTKQRISKILADRQQGGRNGEQ